MKLLKSPLLAVAIAAAAFSTTALTAVAQDAAAVEVNCSASAAATASMVTQLKGAADSEARRAMLQAPLAADPAQALCIMRLVKTSAPELAKDILQDIIAVLSTNPANDELVRILTEEFGDILADAGNIEPAAGDEDLGGGGDEDFGGGDDTPGENPSQLNDEGDGDAGSPSAP